MKPDHFQIKCFLLLAFTQLVIIINNKLKWAICSITYSYKACGKLVTELLLEAKK